MSGPLTNPLKIHGNGRLVFTGEVNTVRFGAPKPREILLSFYVNDEGKVDAAYAPENLTEAARALLVEMSRLQGIEVNAAAHDSEEES